jgi:hypothetical protein
VLASKKVTPIGKKVASGLKKSTSLTKPILSNTLNNAPAMDLSIPSKKKERQNIKLTKLERKMGMPDPKKDLLLNQVNIPNDTMTNLPDLQNIIPEHHPISYEHPLPEQEGKGKNPFKK